MPRLSVTVITLNEERNLPAALESVAWADEIVIVDAGSSDGTLEIARRHTQRVLTRPWDGYSGQKNFAAAQAQYDWILSLDADERVPPALTAEIRALLAHDPPRSGYRIRRVSFYLDRWIRTTDWYPDYQLKLYDRRRGRWNGRYIHESVAVDGPVGVLRHELQHYPYRDISHHLQKIDQYSTLAARALHEQGARAGLVRLLLHPPAAFLRNYILRRGVLDGATGLTVSLLNSYYVFLKIAKLRERQQRTRTLENPENPRT